jgi:hypothetical protein
MDQTRCYCSNRHVYTQTINLHTVKKGKLGRDGVQSHIGLTAFLYIYNRAFPHILGSPSSLCTLSHLNYLVDEEHFSQFFYQGSKL